jgi:hypothetical protein
MSIIQKKRDELIEEINNIDDVELLELLKFILGNRHKSYKLSDAEISMVKESREQIKKGNSKTHQEVLNGIKRWLED